MSAVFSTVHDNKDSDVIADFQEDDNHIIFAVNKFSQGVGAHFVSFIGFIREFSTKSLGSAIQSAHRVDEPVTMDHLVSRSKEGMEWMDDEEREIAENAMEKYVKEQVGAVSFPEEIFYKSTTSSTRLGSGMKSVEGASALSQWRTLSRILRMDRDTTGAVETRRWSM